ncbi:MAG: LEA type 2 family protein [Candidatus Bathyarchaeia archaeon]
MRKGLLALFFLLVALLSCYVGALYFSAISAKVIISSISLPEAVNLLNALVSRRLTIDIYLDVEGHGVLSVPVKSLSGQIYLEEVYIGSVKSADPFTIPASGTRTVRLTYLLDLSSISLHDIQHITQSISEHNGEVNVRFEGYIEPIIIFFPITIPIQYNFYMLTSSNAPKVTQMYWQSTSCLAGEDATFTITVSNVFRGTMVEGVLHVVVREDVKFGSDVDAETYPYTVRLYPGESKTFTGTFKVYKREVTRGFFLKALWGGTVLAEQPNSYPPRLSVTSGSLSLVRAYWTVNSEVVTSCKVGDNVVAHIVVRAENGPVHDKIRVKIRKDIALWPDEDFKVVDFEVLLKKDEVKEYEVAFQPDVASGGNLRGYFIEIEGCISWTMDDAYPPRLIVQSGGTLSIVSVWWTTSRGTVTEAQVGETVQAHIKVKALGGAAQGTVTIRVRKDLPYLPDEDYALQSYTISLGENEEKELTITFMASESTSSTFRGYFIQVDLVTWGTSWTMESSYPPRLAVRETQIPSGMPSLQSAWWTVNGQAVTKVRQGQTVTAHVKITAVGGRAQGTITLRIRKDLALLPDEDYKVQSFSIDLPEGQSIELTVTFVALEKSSLTFRGYFMQVDFTSWGTSWTMESSYPPRLEVL